MYRLTLSALLLVIFTLTLSAQQDRLGLDIASAQMAAKIPVAVANAIEASSAPAALPSILNYYYYGRGQYPNTQLGNELQPRVGDLMLQMGYANIVPATGFQGAQLQDMRQETQIARVIPKYVVVPTISFESVGSKSQTISLSPLGHILGPTFNKVGRVGLEQLEHTVVKTGGKKVEATFALRFYDQSGTQVMIEEACAQKISAEDTATLLVGLSYNLRVENVQTLKPLAVRLMGAMTARLLGKGPCN